jgi:probable F420-dependent oxidoreductase
VHIGVVFPQTEIAADAGAIGAYGRGVEELGYDHLLAYDHVLGADPVVHAPWTRPYDVHTVFQEPFVLFGYLAGITTLGLVTGVVILPQRQTVLVAKQAAQVDVLTGGRLRLGVGIGWNTVEYEAMGEDFGNRARRFEEQIDLLRRLWTQPSLTFDGEYHSVRGAGINPLPVQRPIPVWIGGRSAPAYRRIGRLADGWIPEMEPGAEFDDARAQIDDAARRAGRDPAVLGFEARVPWTGDLGRFLGQAEQWRTLGATHLAVNTMRAGLDGVDGHLEVLARIADELALRR